VGAFLSFDGSLLFRKRKGNRFLGRVRGRINRTDYEDYQEILVNATAQIKSAVGDKLNWIYDTLPAVQIIVQALETKGVTQVLGVFLAPDAAEKFQVVIDPDGFEAAYQDANAETDIFRTPTGYVAVRNQEGITVSAYFSISDDDEPKAAKEMQEFLAGKMPSDYAGKLREVAETDKRFAKSKAARMAKA
jgi:hypothetical protein